MADDKKSKQTETQTFPSNIPKVEIPEVVKYGEKMQPSDEEFIHGTFKHVVSGEPYALCKHAPDTYERTHSLKNTAHFWQGTEEQFRATFEKS